MKRKSAGKIVTFYSYKGGTGRSMALANVAWLLASAGNRVLVIDWDLEAPGLHRYFEPFLEDKTMETSSGLIDFVLDFATAAVTNDAANQTPDWFVSYANILLHAVPVVWNFPMEGALHLIPAGRQDNAYAARVNSFDWARFYEKLGGGILFEATKKSLRAQYDYILVDSRTGVSDTSGICTVQMPDELVVCFTLNRQSIYGASGAAASALQQRTTGLGVQTLKVWPLPMRIEFAEKDRLENARALARTRFAPSFSHLPPDDADVYWGEAEIPYQPYYAYEEVLTAFRDRPREAHSLLASMETIAKYITGNEPPAAPLDEEQRGRGLTLFSERPAANYLEEMTLIGQEYETLRNKMPAGNPRTRLMDSLVARAQQLVSPNGASQVGEQLFHKNTDGSRIAGLALARKEPRRGHIEMVLTGISQSRSAFEQYHALRLAEVIARELDPTAKERLRIAITGALSHTILEADFSRWTLAYKILSGLQSTALGAGWKPTPQKVATALGMENCTLLEIRPSSPYAIYNDIEEQYGPFLASRGPHVVTLPRAYRIAQCFVTNLLYSQFVRARGYERDEFWETPRQRKRLFTADGKTLGPATWTNSSLFPSEKAEHPVTGISFVEVQAFLQWCNSLSGAREDAMWRWCIPTEDAWEYSARSDAGLAYPWGDAFDPALCNSSESGFGGTTTVTQFPAGASTFGCCDMAGNVWEFVGSADAPKDRCVLRGGSYKNNRFECRSYLRLTQVPILHRPADFGFRLAQTGVDRSTPE